MKTIILTTAAARDLDGLTEAPRRAIQSALHNYAVSSVGDVIHMAGGGYRMRVGSYRIIFDEDETTILAIYIGRRTTTTYRK